jgi:hypothetical protein
MSLQQRFDAASKVLGVALRSPAEGVLGLVSLTEIVEQQRVQIAALTERVAQLESAQPSSLPGRLLSAAARAFP